MALTGWLTARRRTSGPDPALRSGVIVSADELIALRIRARSLVLSSRMRATASMSGGQHSRFRGRGIDYQESRIYQPGDDIRHMDWQVTARTGRPHTKLYREERERPVIVLTDFGPTMRFGTREAFKSVIAARAAALIGWATIGQGDRIGAGLFDGSRHAELPPTGGRRGVLRLIRELAGYSATPTGDHQPYALAQALGRLRRVARPGSLVFVISDFTDLNDEVVRHLARLRQHNDLIACQVVDPLELIPPPPGRYGLSNGHDSAVLDTTTPELRQAYQQYFDSHHARVSDTLRRQAVARLQLVTGEDVVDGLRQGLATL